MANLEPGKWNLLQASSGIFLRLLKLCRKKKRKPGNMSRRFIMIWFRHLKTDWFIRRKPVLNQIPFTLAAPDHGRMIVTAANTLAQLQGVDAGMAVADARAVIPSLEVLDDKPGLEEKLLKGLAEWCIRFTPVVAIDS